MKRYLISAFAILSVAVIPQIGAAQTTDALFQQALRMERVHGDYQGAIGVYEKIVGSQSSDRRIVARALVQMGKAYESLGRTEAFSIYERVVRDFTDQAEEVAEARERIAGLGRSRDTVSERPEPMSRTEVDLGENLSDWGAALSPTGRFLVGASTKTPGLRILELATRERSFIPAVQDSEVFGSVRFSPDESKLAHIQRSTGAEHDDVVVLDIPTGRSSTLFDGADYYSKREAREIECTYSQIGDWSRDGSALLVYAVWNDECVRGSDRDAYTEEILLVPLDGSNPTMLAAFSEGRVSVGEDPCLSADGRYAFLDVREDEKSFIRRYDTVTLESVRWRGEQATTMLMGCTWEPTRVLYWAEVLSGWVVRSGAPDALDPEGDEIVIQVGRKAWSLSGSKYGDLAVFPGDRPQEIVVARFDSDTGRLAGERERVTDSYAWGLAWSPSGQLLAWIDIASKDAVTIWDSRDGGKRVVALGERPLSFGWVEEDRLWFSVYTAEVEPGTGQSHHLVTFDLEEERVTSRLDTQVADSLGIVLAKPLGDRNWIAWARERDCVVTLTPDEWEQSDLKCFDRGSFRWMAFHPSPWGEMTLTRGRRPDSTSVLGLISNDGTGYRELRLDDRIVTPLPAIHWVSESQIMYGIRGSDGWESILLIDLPTGESTEVLSDLLEEFEPQGLAISPGGKQVAAFGIGKLIGGGNPVTIIHNVFGGR